MPPVPPVYSKVPAVIDGLVSMFRAEALRAAAAIPPGADGTTAVVVVTDGSPDQGGQVPDNYVAVGYMAAFASQAYSGSTGLSADGVMDISDVGNRQWYEAFTVECECSTYSGDGDPAALSRQRLRTLGVFSTMAAAIAADPTIGGVIGGTGPVAATPAYACVAAYRWLHDRTEEGASATIQFGVRIAGELWLPS